MNIYKIIIKRLGDEYDTYCVSDTIANAIEVVKKANNLYDLDFRKIEFIYCNPFIDSRLTFRETSDNSHKMTAEELKTWMKSQKEIDRIEKLADANIVNKNKFSINKE